jgi:hypothetical protein
MILEWAKLTKAAGNNKLDISADHFGFCASESVGGAGFGAGYRLILQVGLHPMAEDRRRD